MLNFKHRFHGHGSLRYVYKNGSVTRHRMLTVKHTVNKRRKDSRFSVVISKKVLKTAVGRNRIRRRVYEIIRVDLPKLREDLDVVVLVFASELRTMPFEELEQRLHELFTEAGLYKN